MVQEKYVFSDTKEEQEWKRLSAIQNEFDPSTYRRIANLGSAAIAF